MIYGVGKADGVSFPASKHPLYWRWVNMIGRCYYKKHCQYRSYGGKGVGVEDYLKDFGNYVDFVSRLPNYNNLLCEPEKWQIDKDEFGGKNYSRETIQIVTSKRNLEIENCTKIVPVLMLDSDYNVVSSFASICEAGEKTGIHKGNIARSVHTGCRAGGYFWRKNESL